MQRHPCYADEVRRASRLIPIRATPEWIRAEGRTRLALAGVLFASLLSVGIACSRQAAARPNVILISIDSLRGDRLGCYGYPRPVSPTLDRLARDGVLFADVMSQSSWTLPAHVSLMTSLYSHHHGVTSEKKRMRAGQPTLARALHAAGYTTAAVVSGPYVRGAFGFAEGFDRFDESPSIVENRGGHHLGERAARTNRAVLDFLDSSPREPFFLFVHYWDVHYDYAPPHSHTSSDTTIGPHGRSRISIRISASMLRSARGSARSWPRSTTERFATRIG